MVNQDVDGYTKTPHCRIILQKVKEQPTENQKNTETEYKLSADPIFKFTLPGERFSPLVSRQLHQGRQTFSHCGPVSAWHYFAHRPSI